MKTTIPAVIALAIALCNPATMETAHAAPMDKSKSQAATQPAVLTLQQAAALLQVSPQVVEQLADQGKLPGRQLGGQWRFNRQTLMAWLQGEATSDTRSASIAKATEPRQHPPITDFSTADRIARLDAIKGRGAGSSGQPAAADSTASQTDTIGQKPEQATAEEVFLRDYGVLLKGGELTAEADMFYTRTEQRDIRVIPTEVGLYPTMVTLKQDIYTPSISLRYGLMDNLQLSASTSYQYRKTTLQNGTRLDGDSSGDLGVADATLRYAVLKERTGLPSIVLSLSGQVPIDHGSKGIGGGVAFSKSLDPAVLFGSFNYRHLYIDKDVDIDRLQAKNTYSTNLGIAYALNDSLTLSTAVAGVFEDSTRTDTAKLPSQQNYSLQLGLTSWLTKGLYIEPTVSFSLNGNNSVTFGLQVPYTF